MKRKIPEDLNPYTKKKFEAIHTYDPYDDAITELNQAFHHSYNHLVHQKHETLGKKGAPVIIIFEGKAMLFHDDEQETAEILPDLYHRVKSISHVSFAIFIELASNGYGPLKEESRIDLKHKKELIESVLDILDEAAIPANYMDLQKATLSNALEIINEILASSTVDEDKVKNFCQENAQHYLANAALSAELELDVLNETVMKWKEMLGPENWKAINVVICAGHQARYRETAVQYFQSLLHEKENLGAGNEDRVIYAEHIHDVDGALDLVARHMIDQNASNVFFGEKHRLQKDLMADGTEKYLKKLLSDD